MRNPITGQRFGRRNTILLILAVIQAVIGWSNLVAPPQSLATLTVFRVIPQIVLGLWWVIPAAVGLLAALIDRTDRDHAGWGWDGVSFFLSYSTIAFWGFAFIASYYPFGELDFGAAIRAAVIYWGFAAIVLVVAGWEENLPKLEVNEVPPVPSRGE